MTTHRVTKVLLVFMCLSLLFLSGCANYLTPQLGAIARPNDRFKLVKDGVYDGDLNTNNLDMTYSLADSGKTFNFKGSLSFSDSLTNSFPVVENFILKMNFLDAEGRVLQTIDISPLLDFEVAPDQIPVKASGSIPTTASAIAFNFFGQFKDNGLLRNSDSTEIFYFPFD
jgi:hypothetical protein